MRHGGKININALRVERNKRDAHLESRTVERDVVARCRELIDPARSTREDLLVNKVFILHEDFGGSGGQRSQAVE